MRRGGRRKRPRWWRRRREIGGGIAARERAGLVRFPVPRGSPVGKPFHADGGCFGVSRRDLGHRSTDGALSVPDHILWPFWRPRIWPFGLDPFLAARLGAMDDRPRRRIHDQRDGATRIDARP